MKFGDKEVDLELITHVEKVNRRTYRICFLDGSSEQVSADMGRDISLEWSSVVVDRIFGKGK